MPSVPKLRLWKKPSGKRKVVLEDILQGGNQNCIIPGQFEAEFAELTRKANGLLFSEKEILEFNSIAEECGAETWKISDFDESGS